MIHNEILTSVLAGRASAAGLELKSEWVPRLEAYYHELAKWNRRVNLTALALDGYPAGSVDRLLIEPLIGAQLVPDKPLSLYDLGSGGGSPAIPLAIARPQIRLTMVEARQRKAAFLRHVSHLVGLKVNVLGQRIEKVARAHRGLADWVSIRAVRVESIADEIRMLLTPSGRVLHFGIAADSVMQSAWLELDEILSLPGLSAIRVFHVEHQGP